ncbi:amino acid permease [Enterococcus sp. 669A]|uniref:Amino acid permease n=1 Tax=Candidatus Enterococcus moelleringii TaxID=2815325 RepID=A0ABS3L9C8_9ENTE|nr:amino acid permease [Enterococcus sp. 669A]MBO1305673.1 amino acid permease [Enterococcus sp. 669A]
MSNKNEEVQLNTDSSESLNRGMKTHHIAMLSVGGTIGTGLFLGTGYVVQQAGPGGTFIAYGFGALIMVLMMLCMGEMLVEMPVSGNVQAYASKFLGYGAGFTVGWIKWLQLAITVPTQIVASSIIMGNIIPQVPSLVWIIGFAMLLFFLNSRSSEDYGSSSFFFSSIKVILIVVFALVGIGIITGLVGGEAVGLANFTNDGGLFPTGMRPIMMSMMTAVFAYSGADMFATAAGESENPEVVLPKAIKVSSLSIIISYAVTLFILIAVLPWRQADLLGSPFAYVFRELGIGSAELIVNLVIVTSALSSANAHVFAAVRTLWSLGHFEQAPSFVKKTNKKKVPMNALLVTTCFTLFAVTASFVSPDVVYLFMTSFIGAAELVVYAITGVCALKYRKVFLGKGKKIADLKFKIPLFPFIPILLIVLCILVATGMVLDPTQRGALTTGAPVFIALFIGSTVWNNTRRKGLKTPTGE